MELHTKRDASNEVVTLFHGYPLNRVVLILQKSEEDPTIWLRIPADQPSYELAAAQYELAARSFLDQFDFWGNVLVRYVAHHTTAGGCQVSFLTVYFPAAWLRFDAHVMTTASRPSEQWIS